METASATATATGLACPPCQRCSSYLEEALRIQESLAPVAYLHDVGVDIASRYLPFSEVSGDFADFFHLPEGNVGLYLGDLVGKGLPAAMYAALLTETLRGIHKTGAKTACVMELLNQRLRQRPLSGRFCSTLYALFNPDTRKLVFANAGLPLPLLISGTSCRALGEGGLPSGWFPFASFQRHVVRLSPRHGLVRH